MKYIDALTTFRYHPSLPQSIQNREKWTIEILRILFLITVIPTLLVFVCILAGVFSPRESLPLFLDLVLLAVGWQGAKRGGWRWAGFIPSLICYILAVSSLGRYNIENSTLLMLAMAVLLSCLLLDNRISIFFVILCSISFAVIEWPERGVRTELYIASVLIVFICLSGMMLVMWYFLNQLNRYTTEHLQAVDALHEEIRLRQKAEETQQLQESQLKRLTDHMTDLVAEIELNGKFLYVSPSYKTVMGYSPEDLITINAFDTVHPDDLELVKHTIQKALTTGNPEKLQYRVKHAAGHYIWVETSGIFIDLNDRGEKSLVISSHDITYQRQIEEINQASEKKYRSVIEGVPLGLHMYALDEEYRLRLIGFNPAANLILQTDHEAMLGKTIEENFPSFVETELPDRYREVALKGIPWTGRYISKTGEKINGVYEISAFQTSPGRMALFFSNIIEKIKNEEALRLSEAKFSSAFHTSPDSINITRLSDGRYLDINRAYTEMTGYTREDAIGKTSIELNIWVDLKDRERLVETLQKFGYCHDLEAGFRTKDGRIIQGIMSASLLDVNGEHCLISITRDISERIRSEIRLRETHEKLEGAYKATLEGWARALDLREHETADHSRRVVEYSLKTASAMGINEEGLLDIQRGALLHDIGKVGVPDNILLKPGALTNDEWVIMRQHPLNAYLLLKDIEYLQTALDIPYAHHERWDGTGYPRGLKGEDIPLFARIFAVVDVWDALLSDRPYRLAWDKKAVLDYIRDQNGRLFDPAVVDIFLNIVDREENPSG